MGLLRKLASVLGFVRDDGHGGAEEEEGVDAPPRRPGKGFGVQVSVPADRPAPGPVLIPCALGEGGVQGLRWYSRRLRVDEDGDVADEFLDEILSSKASFSVDNEQITPQTKFQVRYTTVRPVVRKQIVAVDGNVHHNIEHQGKLRWV